MALQDRLIGGGVVGMGQRASPRRGRGDDLERSIDRMHELDEYFARGADPESDAIILEEALREADVVIGAVLVPGALAPQLVTREMLGLMKPRSVIVDVAIDQGGCFETSHPTTHAEPVFEVDGILHYCVANMPGAVPVTATRALTNATLPCPPPRRTRAPTRRSPTITASRRAQRKGRRIVTRPSPRYAQGRPWPPGSTPHTPTSPRDTKSLITDRTIRTNLADQLTALRDARRPAPMQSRDAIAPRIRAARNLTRAPWRRIIDAASASSDQGGFASVPTPEGVTGAHGRCWASGRGSAPPGFRPGVSLDSPGSHRPAVGARANAMGETGT